MVSTWEEYVENKNRERLVFVGDGQENHNEILVAPYSHRFQQGYTRMQYAKMQGFVSGALEEYDDPYLVFLTFSTSTASDTEGLRPPIDVLDEVTATWRPDRGTGVYYELKHSMASSREDDEGPPRDDWEYLYILEPTTDEGHVPGGYPHAHAAIVVDGEVARGRFESSITKHVELAPRATGRAHEFDDAIEIKSAEELNNPGAYLFKYLGKSWDVEDMEDYEKRFAALIFDQGRQRFRASNGAQRWMRREEEESESGEWIFAGVATDYQARELRDFDDYEDFLVATNSPGLRSWLTESKRGESDPLSLIEPETEPAYPAGYVEACPGLAPSSEIGTAPTGDRPPP